MPCTTIAQGLAAVQYLVNGQIVNPNPQIYRLSYIDDVGRTGEQLKYTNIRVSLTQIALYKITVVQQIRVYKTNAKPLFNTNFNDKQAKKLHFNL